MSRSSVVIEQVRDRSVVVGVHSESPLRLLTPSNRGHAAWVYQSTLGGGFVGRDSVELEIEVRPRATAFVSAHASSKAYRDADSRFALEATVARDATLIIWPEPVSCFSRSSLTQHQRVRLADASSSVALVDSFTSGRAAHGERWAFERLESRLHLDVGDTPWLREAFRLDARAGALPERMSGLDAFSTIVLKGPRFAPVCAAISPRLEGDCVVAVSPRADGAVVRLAAARVEVMLLRLRELLREPVAQLLGDVPLDPVLGRSATAPEIDGASARTF